MGRSLWGPSLRQGCRRAVGRSRECLCPPPAGKASLESEPGPQGQDDDFGQMGHFEQKPLRCQGECPELLESSAGREGRVRRQVLKEKV